MRKNERLESLRVLTEQLVNRDISLKRVYERLNLALDLCDIGVWDLDIPTGLLSWDDRMARIFGRTVDTVRDFYDCVHKDDIETVKSTVAASIKSKAPYDIGYRINTADGIKYIHARGEITSDGLRFIGVCVVKREIL